MNLSHNRIEDLTPFKELGGKKNCLKEINLNDNLISDIDQVAYLTKFKTLIRVHFQDRKRNTDNPICDLKNYTETVQTYLPYLKELDGVNIKEQENISVNQSKHVSFREYQAPPSVTKSTKSWVTPQAAYRSEPDVYNPPFSIKPSKINFTPVQIPLKLHEKDEMIQKLHYELHSIKEHCQNLENDKSEAISQINSVEAHYQKVVSFMISLILKL